MDIGAASAADADADGGSLIPDLNDVPIEVLLDDDESILSTALRRLVSDMNRPAENYAAHSNSF
jgi:hypothetical protein